MKIEKGDRAKSFRAAHRISGESLLGRDFLPMGLEAGAEERRAAVSIVPQHRVAGVKQFLLFHRMMLWLPVQLSPARTALITIRTTE